MSQPQFATAANLFDAWKSDLIGGVAPTLYPVGDGDLARMEIGPGLVTLLGGCPGAGKTALVMQLVCEALGRTTTLRALVANVEMPPSVLLDRQLARLGDIDLSAIRHRRLGAEHGPGLERGLDAVGRIADRLAFVLPPFDLGNIAACGDAFAADLIVLDYVQRIAPPGEHRDKRSSVDAIMGFLRQFADAGMAVVVVAALSRQKDAKGRSGYSGDSLNLAAFKESGELEYGADSALILATEPKDRSRATLKFLKNRHGEADDIALAFDRPRQRFSSIHDAASGPTPPAATDPLSAALRAAWDATPAQPDEPAGGGPGR